MACSGLLNPDLVRQIASKYNYEELDVSFKERGSKLSFKHSWKEGCGGPDNEGGPVRINVWFTTGKVSTSLDHPTARRGQLYRDTGPDYEMLEAIFDNPRYHSNNGYRTRKEKKKMENRREEQVALNVNIEVGERGFGILYEDESMPKLFGPIAGMDETRAVVLVVTVAANFAKKHGYSRVMLKTGSEKMKNLLSDFDEDNDDEVFADFVETKRSMEIFCTPSNHGVAWQLANDGSEIGNFYHGTREFLMIKYLNSGRLAREELLPPSLLLSAATYVIKDPWKMSLRARISTSEDVIEDLKISQKNVLVMLSPESPFMAVRTNPKVREDGTVLIKAHTNGTPIGEKTLIILKNTILGMAFSGIYKCCNNAGAPVPPFGECRARCQWSAINSLHWMGGSDPDVIESDILF